MEGNCRVEDDERGKALIQSEPRETGVKGLVRNVDQ